MEHIFNPLLDKKVLWHVIYFCEVFSGGVLCILLGAVALSGYIQFLFPFSIKIYFGVSES